MPNDRGRKRSEDDNSHAQRRAKRVRVSQACNECRKKKERCDGVQPQCGPCTSLNRSCCFDAQPRRRGLPTGYVRAVEVFLGLMFHSIDGIEHRATSILRGERGLPPWNLEQSLPMTLNSLADAWRHSGTMKELEQLLAGVEPGDECELSTRDLYEKLEGAFMNRLVLKDDLNSRVELLSPPRTNTPSMLEQLAPDVATENEGAILPVSNDTPLVPALQVCQKAMDLPNDWSHLLDRYFTDTHTWFPIAPKHDVLRQAFCLANSNLEEESQECMISKGDRAGAFATLAYASYRDTLSIRDRAGHIEPSFASAEEQDGAHSASLTRRLQNKAMFILNQDKEPIEYDAGHVQVLLVLTILQVDQGSLEQAWITIGQAVRIAVILKIIPSSHRDIGLVVSDKQRRLFLGIYVLETLIAYTLEQRPHLKRVDLAKIGSLPVDGIEEWEAWRPLEPHGSTTGRSTRTPGRSLSAFNTFLNLVTLLNDYAHGTSSLEQTLQHFQSWKKTLPAAHQNASASIETFSLDTPPQTRNLILASLSIDVLLHVKSFLARDSAKSPASLTAIPISARETLEAVMRHRRLVMPSQACPLMAIYISMIESEVDLHGNSGGLQHLPVPSNRLPEPTNNERSLDYLELEMTQSYPPSMQPAAPNASFGDLQVFEPFGAHSLGLQDADTSLFDSLAFLDTTDCSHQSGRFLENLGVSSEVTPFDIGTLFAR